MSKLEVFQNGVFSNTGEPVFQIGTKQEDGTYVTEVFDLMGKGEAEAKLNELQPPAVEKKAAPKKAAPKVKIPSTTDPKAMNKDELEVEMRNHGLELDRRKSKNALVKQYQKLFEMEGINLIFDKKAIDIIVDRAMEFKLGARGLRSICEAIMLDAMFEFPSDESKKELKITASYVKAQLSRVSSTKLKVA